MRTMAWLGVGLVALAACSSDNGGGSGTSGDVTTGTGTGTSTGTGGATSSAGGGGSGGSSPGAGGAGGGTADTWTNFAQQFFKTYCVECHGATDTAGNVFTTLAGVMKDAPKIRCGVAPKGTIEPGCTSADPPPGQFPISDGKTPPNPKPTDMERTRIVAWIDAGLPQ